MLPQSMGKIDGKPNVVYPPAEKMKFLDYLIEETVSSLRHGLQERPQVGCSFSGPVLD